MGTGRKAYFLTRPIDDNKVYEMSSLNGHQSYSVKSNATETRLDRKRFDELAEAVKVKLIDQAKETVSELLFKFSTNDLMGLG